MDYDYSYGEALGATGEEDDPFVVRPVQFVRWAGVATWNRVNLSTGRIESRRVTGDNESDQLGPLLDMAGDNCKQMITAALQRLEEIRSNGQQNAGMLITAMDQRHCESIASWLRMQRITDIKIVTYDTPGAADEIRRFERSHDRILIAVKMISEGIDIKRLRVGVYASNVLTRMFFSQFIGRFIRWDSSIDASQFASVFIPQHRILLRYATEIEKMVIDAQIAMTSTDGNGVTPGTFIRTELQSDGDANGIIEREVAIERAETIELHEMLKSAGLAGHISEGVARVLIDQFRQRHPETVRPDSPAADQPDEWKRLSIANDKAVGMIKYRSGLTYNEIQMAANNAVGIVRKDALTPADVLERRLQFLQKWLAQLLQEKKDA